MPKVIANPSIANVSGIKSEPPTNKQKVKNIWWDAEKGEFVFDVE